LSAPLFSPQSAPRRAQNAAFVSGVHPHCFGVPPPPHVTPVPEQVPQLETVRVAPQRSAVVMEPQEAPSSAHSAWSLSGVHPHTFATAGTPPPHVCPVPLHPPQFSEPPHSSAI
jgi:hypothetical protein